MLKCLLMCKHLGIILIRQLIVYPAERMCGTKGPLNVGAMYSLIAEWHDMSRICVIDIAWYAYDMRILCNMT